MDNEGWQVADALVPHTERVFTVNGLQPARTYQFRVSAINDVGEGPSSVASELIEMPQQRKKFDFNILLYYPTLYIEVMQVLPPM